MRRALIYLLFGLTTTGWAVYVDRSGGMLTTADRLTNVPRSIRDNPGAYRSLYSGGTRTFGGK